MRERRVETEDEASTEAEEQEEESGEVAGITSNLIIETAGTEEEAAEGLANALGMEVEGGQGERGRGRGWRDSTVTGSP